jgi:hypothetical protein
MTSSGFLVRQPDQATDEVAKSGPNPPFLRPTVRHADQSMAQTGAYGPIRSLVRPLVRQPDQAKTEAAG